MTTQTEALKMAIKALSFSLVDTKGVNDDLRWTLNVPYSLASEAINACKEALQSQEQEYFELGVKSELGKGFVYTYRILPDENGLYWITQSDLRGALESQEQEPVAWMHRHAGEITEFNDFKSCEYCEPLYTHPKEWQGLSDEEVSLIAFNVEPQDWNDTRYRECWFMGFKKGAHEIAKELKEKNT